MSSPPLHVRKELLKVRASLERIELTHNVMDIREAASPRALFGSVFGGLGLGLGAAGARGQGRDHGHGGGGLAGALSGALASVGGLRGLSSLVVPGGLAAGGPALALQLFRMFRRSPIKVSAVALGGARLAKTGFKVGVVGYLGYQGFKLWQYWNRPMRFRGNPIPHDVGYESAPPSASGQTSAYP
jgi:hypothetical protein